MSLVKQASNLVLSAPALKRSAPSSLSLKKDGVLVGCDQNQEWMLKWWWNNYSTFNTLPVAFIDFGMSKSAKLWCKSKGSLISISIDKKHFDTEERSNPSLKKNWEASYSGSVWPLRKIWHLKAFGLAKTPFLRSIWTDIDCEILGNIEPILEFSENSIGFGVAEESERSQNANRKLQLLKPEEIGYNSGVLAFKKTSPLLAKWTENTLKWHLEFMGDQDILNRTIFLEKLSVSKIPNIYNWRMTDGENQSAIIIHWVAERGKQEIFSKFLKTLTF